MTPPKNRRYVYKASAVGAAGYLSNPTVHRIDVQASCALPVSGGYGSNRVENFRYKELISFRAAYTQVSGTWSSKDRGSNSLATATIEKLDILGIVTADLVVAHVASRHRAQGQPGDPDQPEIVTVGSYFKNLRIAGRKIEIDLDDKLFSDKPRFNDLREHATSAKDFQPRLLKPFYANPDHVHAEELQVAEPAVRADDYKIACTLVKDCESLPPGVKREGHVFHIPHFGTVHLAECICTPYKKRLTMLRLEMGSPAEGDAALADAEGGGRWEP
ncbi:MAG TPA: choice-of-anchor P family protein [Bryobacteraceae bacterium]|nr:choice-of-anchor P family protein [Bryobacteraceae bacterium]